MQPRRNKQTERNIHKTPSTTRLKTRIPTQQQKNDDHIAYEVDDRESRDHLVDLRLLMYSVKEMEQNRWLDMMKRSIILRILLSSLSSLISPDICTAIWVVVVVLVFQRFNTHSNFRFHRNNLGSSRFLLSRIFPTLSLTWIQSRNLRHQTVSKPCTLRKITQQSPLRCVRLCLPVRVFLTRSFCYDLNFHFSSVAFAIFFYSAEPYSGWGLAWTNRKRAKRATTGHSWK